MLLLRPDTIIRVSRNTRISYQWENSKNILVHVLFIILASIFKKEIISPILDYIWLFSWWILGSGRFGHVQSSMDNLFWSSWANPSIFDSTKSWHLVSVFASSSFVSIESGFESFWFDLENIARKSTSGARDISPKNKEKTRQNTMMIKRIEIEPKGS